MGYIESLLRARIVAILLMGACAATTTGLAGKGELLLRWRRERV